MITSNDFKIAANRTEINLFRDSTGKVLDQSIQFTNILFSGLTGDARGSIMLGSTQFSASEIPAKYIIEVNGETTIDFVGLYESDEHKLKLTQIGVKVDGFVAPGFSNSYSDASGNASGNIDALGIV